MENHVLKNKTLWVIIITLITMVAEIGFGILTKSMALTADGFHMGTHALALSVTFVVCLVIDRYRDKEEVLNALGGYTSALLLGLTSLLIIYESAERLIYPLDISYNEAILVTVIGLIVNLVCILIMSEHHVHCHDGHHHEEEHEHKENLNFKAAYLHIAADALTSLMAIAALLAAKYMGWVFLDPLTGFIGGAVILKWSVNLTKQSVGILIGGRSNK